MICFFVPSASRIPSNASASSAAFANCQSKAHICCGIKLQLASVFTQCLQRFLLLRCTTVGIMAIQSTGPWYCSKLNEPPLLSRV